MDTVQAWRPALQCAREFFGVDHLVFGTDFPWGPAGGERYIEKSLAAVELIELTAEERSMILGGNAGRLFANGGPNNGHRYGRRNCESGMLILSNEDVRAVLSMAGALEALEPAYRDFADGRSHATTTRLDTRVTLNDSGHFFSFMSMEGTTPRGEVMALRFNANHEVFHTLNGKTKKTHLSSAPGERYLGLVLLVSMRDTQPLALLHDGYLSALRVGATSALAARHLALPDAGEVALFGYGDQARTQLLGLAEVRVLRRVRVSSRNRARREAFAAEMSSELGIPVVPTDDPAQAVREADLVVAATNSLDPVFSSGWLAEGTHVGAIVPGEVDDDLYQRSDLTVVNSKVPFGNERGYIAGSDMAWDQFPDLGELVTGRAAGRSHERQISVFMNNAGLGFQFAACGWMAYERARERGLGHDIPADWLLQPVSAWPASHAGSSNGAPT